MINLNNYLASMNALIFRWARLHELTAPEWHAVMAAREAVFIVEQNCPYQDADALDAQSWHLIGTYYGFSPLTCAWSIRAANRCMPARSTPNPRSGVC